ncbi:MAG: hypothetical protein JXQ85_14675 [Cognatishimia sp.]|uniref:hypothetical protein n=1 Tax=Cognatishimia sp. TaxID=2211648 RepID=UPI003B8CDFAA
MDFKDQLTDFSEGSQEFEPQEMASKLAGIMKAVAKVLVAMRRDVGYSFTSISAKDLARLQLATDPETKMIFDHL